MWCRRTQGYIPDAESMSCAGWQIERLESEAIKYHCELWITKPDKFLVEADSIKEAKEKVVKIAAEKMKMEDER